MSSGFWSRHRFELIGFGRSEFASGEEVNFVSIFCHRMLNATLTTSYTAVREFSDVTWPES